MVGTNLQQGKTQSCGCLVREKMAARAKHGHCRGGKTTSIYTRWKAIKQRCLNPNSAAYVHYGGRDITLCHRWFEFENFYADVGDPPPGLTIDRTDVNGDYGPWNWRWATRSMQNYNQRRSLNKPVKIKRPIGRPLGSKDKHPRKPYARRAPKD